MNMTNSMSHRFQLICMMMAGALIITASVFVPSVYAKGANFPHANDVAHNANTNGPYIKDCKEHDSAKDCATGPGNNGEFTSGAAHEINKPNK